MQDGRLPNVGAWRRGFREVVGEAFAIRGIEVTVEGWLVKRHDQLALEVPGTGQVLGLAPAERKVQWDLERQRAQMLTSEERQTYEKLAAAWNGQPRRLRVVGLLAESAKADQLPTVEVRQVLEIHGPKDKDQLRD